MSDCLPHIIHQRTYHQYLELGLIIHQPTVDKLKTMQEVERAENSQCVGYTQRDRGARPMPQPSGAWLPRSGASRRGFLKGTLWA